MSVSIDNKHRLIFNGLCFSFCKRQDLMKQFVSYFITAISVILLFTTMSVAKTVPELFDALQQKDWDNARKVANQLDAKNNRGDIFLAFTNSVEAVNRGDCKVAKQLSTLVIQQSPGFIPAYDILAECLIKEGDSEGASKLFQKLANDLREGPEKKLAQRKADTLKPDLSPRVSFDFSIIPSTNTSRRTRRTSTGNGGVLSEASRAQDGVTISSSIKLTKPIFHSKRLLSQASIKLGGRYNSVTETVLPLVGTELRNTWFLSNTKSVYAAPFYEYTWKSGERLFDEYGIRVGGNFSLTQAQKISADFVISKRDFKETGQDATFASGLINNTVLIDEFSRFNYYISASNVDADNSFFNVTDYSIGVELETAYKNGFITSLGGIVGTRRFDRNAPLTSDERKDTYYTASYGVSHKELVFYDIRPEIVYSYTNQSSNDLFNDFSAHDIGLKLKAAF